MLGLTWIIVALAALGALLLAFSGASTRLLFPLQYSNASGALFAVGTLLACSSSNRNLRSAAPLSFYALLLTQSGGALLACLLASLVSLVPRLRETACNVKALPLIVTVFGGLLAFIAGFLLAPLAGFLVVCLVVAGMWWLSSGKSEFTLDRRILIACGALSLIAAGAIAFLLQDRVYEASQTFIERFIQSSDGLGLLAANPLLGVGPNQWQFFYQDIQTAQYQANVIHNSYLEIALDSGVFTLVAWVAALALCLRVCWRSRNGGAFAAVVFLALHGVIDFDVRFTALATLPFLIASGAAISEKPVSQARQKEPGTASTPPAIPSLPAAITAITLAVLFLGGCISGAFYAAQLNQLQNMVDAGQPISAEQAAAPLYENDPAVQDLYLQSLAKVGNYQNIAEWLKTHTPQTDAQLLLGTEALYQTGSNNAAQLLLEGMEKRPFSRSLYQQAQGLFSLYGLSPEDQETLNQLIAAANEALTSGNAALLNNQKPVNLEADPKEA